MSSSPVLEFDSELMRDLDDMKEFLGRQESVEEAPSAAAKEALPAKEEPVVDTAADGVFPFSPKPQFDEESRSWPYLEAEEPRGTRRTQPDKFDQIREELDRLDVLDDDDELPTDALAFLEDAASQNHVRGLEDCGFPLKGTPPVSQKKRVVEDAASYGLYEDTKDPVPVRTHQPEDEGQAISYKEFLARLMLPQSAELVSHVRAFVVRTLEEARERDDAVRARKPDAAAKRRKALKELPSRCAKFFDAAESHLEDHAAWKSLGHLGVTSARSALEKYVLTKLGSWAFEASRDDDKDRALQRRCRALASFVTPERLDIKPGLCDNEVVLHIARDELRRMDAVKAPSDKVECVVRCASIIFSALNLSRAGKSTARSDDDDDLQHEEDDDGGGLELDASSSSFLREKKKKSSQRETSRAGADDFLPVFIYVVLNADAPRLYSNCEYIQDFHNPAALMSKAGYCFVNLRSAIEFLLTLQGDQIGMADTDFRDNLERGLVATASSGFSHSHHNAVADATTNERPRRR